jgi:excisionase family DNA binding protein
MQERGSPGPALTVKFRSVRRLPSMGPYVAWTSCSGSKPRPEAYWSVPEAAERLGISVGYLRVLIRKGEVAVVRAGALMISERELQRVAEWRRRQ